MKGREKMADRLETLESKEQCNGAFTGGGFFCLLYPRLGTKEASDPEVTTDASNKSLQLKPVFLSKNQKSSKTENF